MSPSAISTAPPLTWDKIWRNLPALLLLANAIVNLLAALMPHSRGLLFWTEHMLPLEVAEHARLLLFLSGLVLLALTHGIARRKHMAWVLTQVLLALSMALHLGREFDMGRVTLCGTLFCMLWARRREYIAQSDQPSIRWGLLMLVPLLVGSLAYGWISLGHLGEALHGPVNPWTRVQTVAELVFLQDTDTLSPSTPHARVVFNTISTGGLLAAFLAVGLFLRPVFRRREAPKEEQSRARQLLAEFGDDAVQPFATLPDKHYFFGQGGGMIAYALWRNVPVVLGDPVAPEGASPALLREFAAFCQVQDWVPVLYNVTTRHLAVFNELGWKSLRISEDADIPLAEFSLKGKKMQNLRTTMNKAEREGVKMEWRQGAGLDAATAEALRRISDSWVARHSGKELGFDLGSFDLNQLRENGVALARDAKGEVQAFTSWLPFDHGRGRVLDLMRASDEFANGLDFLITASLLHFQAQGLMRASLGNAPLANLSEPPADGPSPLPDRIVEYIYLNFDRWYGFKGLFAFKQKYQPEWKPRFLIYPNDANLPMAALALIRVHLPKGLWSYLRS